MLGFRHDRAAGKVARRPFRVAAVQTFHSSNAHRRYQGRVLGKLARTHTHTQRERERERERERIKDAAAHVSREMTSDREELFRTSQKVSAVRQKRGSVQTCSESSTGAHM